MARALGLGEGGVGRLEAPQDVVPEEDRVGERAERLGVLGEARHRQRSRLAAERDDEPLVPDRERARLRLDLDDAPLGVVLARDASEEQLRMRAHLPERDDDVARLDRARRRLGQQRREEHEVLEVDDGGSALTEQAGHPGAREAASEDQRPAVRLALLHGPSLSLRRRRRRRRITRLVRAL